MAPTGLVRRGRTEPLCSSGCCAPSLPGCAPCTVRVGAAAWAQGSRELFLSHLSNCMHRASSLGSSQLPLAMEDLGSGSALESPKCLLSAGAPQPHGEPQRLFPRKRPGHAAKQDQLQRGLISTKHEPWQALRWSDHAAPGFVEAGERQPHRPDIPSSSREGATCSWGVRGSCSTCCGMNPAASCRFPHQRGNGEAALQVTLGTKC